VNKLLIKDIEMTSLDLAEITGKQHAHIMRDIRTEVEKLGEVGQSIFGESSYTNSQNKKQPCYKFGRKGAMQLALKYDAVTRFKVIERIEQLEQGQAIQNLSPQLQLLISMELKQKEQDERIEAQEQALQGIRDVIRLDTTSWRKDSQVLINKMAKNIGGNQYISIIRTEIYNLVDSRLHARLNIRLGNKQRRMKEMGVSKSKVDKLNFLDVIADDPKLIEGYVAIVKEMAIKKGVA